MMKSGSELSFKGICFGEDGDVQVSAHTPLGITENSGFYLLNS